jgi:hypothetical protein
VKQLIGYGPAEKIVSPLTRIRHDSKCGLDLAVRCFPASED